MWNYEIYEVGTNQKDNGKACLIDFERLLPPYLYSVVYQEQNTKPFKLEMISKNTIYKIWK